MAETWIVESQVPDEVLGADGRLVEGYRVTIRTAHGDVGRFFVSADVYTPENVRVQAEELAQRLIAVRQL